MLRREFVHSFDRWPVGTAVRWAPIKEYTQVYYVFRSETSVRDMATIANSPNLIPEFGELFLVFWIKSEFRLGVDDDPWIESSMAEHHCQFDVGISVKDALWIRVSIKTEATT